MIQFITRQSGTVVQHDNRKRFPPQNWTGWSHSGKTFKSCKIQLRERRD